MLHSFGKLFDHLFPPAEEVLVARQLTAADVLRHYTPRLVGSTHTLLPYHESEIQALIKAVKFFHHRPSARLLADAVDRWLAEQERSYVIIPVPLSRARERERGHNQVTSVLSLVQKVPALHRMDVSVLRRDKDTKPQTSLQKAKRSENVRHAFSTNDSTGLTDNHILLVDDVMTTGATLKAAEAALQPLRPASITKLAFAH